MSNLQPIDIEILPKLGKTGFLEGYNGITLCSVNGIVRITSLIEREIESLSVVFRGSYNQPKSTVSREKRGISFMKRKQTILQDSQISNKLLDIMSRRPSFQRDSGYPVPARTSTIKIFKFSIDCPKDAALPPSYPDQTVYSIVVRLKYVDSNEDIERAIEIKHVPQFRYEVLNPFFNPIPITFKPDDFDPLPVEYALELDTEYLAPGETLFFTYSVKSKNDEYRIKGISFQLRERVVLAVPDKKTRTTSFVTGKQARITWQDDTPTEESKTVDFDIPSLNAILPTGDFPMIKVKHKVVISIKVATPMGTKYIRKEIPVQVLSFDYDMAKSAAEFTNSRVENGTFDGVNLDMLKVHVNDVVGEEFYNTNEPINDVEKPSETPLNDQDKKAFNNQKSPSANPLYDIVFQDDKLMDDYFLSLNIDSYENEERKDIQNTVGWKTSKPFPRKSSLNDEGMGTTPKFVSDVEDDKNMPSAILKGPTIIQSSFPESRASAYKDIPDLEIKTIQGNGIIQHKGLDGDLVSWTSTYYQNILKNQIAKSPDDELMNLVYAQENMNVQRRKFVESEVDYNIDDLKSFFQKRKI